MSARLRSTALLFLIVLAARPAWALREGALGNSPISAQAGWPEGAAAVFNAPQRIAFWEHNGKWTSECRGDAEAINKVLAHFALIKTEGKKLILHDGVGTSYWVQAVQPDGDAKVDWIFTVWQAEIWRQWQAIGRGGAPVPDAPPAPQLDVYVGGNLNLDDVEIPEGIKVVDQRLESRGFQLADGNVLEGKVHDLTTGKPLAARMRLLRLDRNPAGGYDYVEVASADADDEGRWVVKNVPQGTHQITLAAHGYASRVVGYVELGDQPGWSGFNADLSPAVALSGTVTDDAGHPLEGVTVGLESAYGLATTDLLTDRNGRFEFNGLPKGPLSVFIHKDAYVHLGLADTLEAPAADVKLTMVRAGGIDVVVDFGGKAKPEEYLVNIEPEGGLKIGSWGGAGRVDGSGFAKFTNVPPGKYVLWGRPNPGADSDETKKVPVEVKGGETSEVTVKAK